MTKHAVSLLFVALMMPSVCSGSKAHPGRNDAADLADLRAHCDAKRHAHLVAVSVSLEQASKVERFDRGNDGEWLEMTLAEVEESVKRKSNTGLDCFPERRLAQLQGAPSRTGSAPPETALTSNEAVVDASAAPTTSLKGLEESKCLVFTPSDPDSTELGKIHNKCDYPITGAWCVEGVDCGKSGYTKNFEPVNVPGFSTSVQGTAGGVGDDRVTRGACRGKDTYHGPLGSFSCDPPSSAPADQPTGW